MSARGTSSVLPLFSKRKLDFDNLGSSSSQEVLLVKALDVSAYTSATLLVRIHAIDIGSSRDLDIEIYDTGPSTEEPSVDFVGAEALIAARIDGKSVGDLVVAPVPTPIGSHLRIIAKATNPASPGGSSFDATVSAELVVHSSRRSHPAIRVQRGTASFGASADTSTIGIHPVRSTSRAFARITGVAQSSGGLSAGSTASKNNDDLGVTCRLTDTDEITLTRESTGEDADYEVWWELWEYVGPSGGTHEFKVILDADIAVADATSTNTASITATDTSNCVPFITGQRGATTTASWSRQAHTAQINSGPDQVQIDRVTATDAQTVSVAVVEFTGSAWSVQNNITHTSTAGGTDQTETITDVEDWTTAFVVSSNGRTSFDSNNRLGGGVRPGATTTTLRFYVGLQTVDFVAHVVKATDLRIEHLDDITGTGAQHPDSGTPPQEIDTPVQNVPDLSRTAAMAFTATGGGANGYPGPHWQYGLTRTNNLRWWRGRIVGVADWAAQIIQFPTL